MWIVLSLALLTIACQQLRMRALRRYLTALHQQIATRQRSLFVETASWARSFQLDRLTASFNELIAETEESRRQSRSYFNQIETTLGNLMEAVLIVNEAGQIRLANAAARELLNLRPNYDGQRLETVITSSVFLEYMNELRDKRVSEHRWIELVVGRNTLYFEVTGARVDNPFETGESLSLFVLHDITRMTQLERVRRDFVANVSHELRTPVTVIKGFIDTLFEDYHSLSCNERKNFINKVRKNTIRLHNLLEDLLSLSRLESGNTPLNLEMMDIQHLIREFIEDVEPRCSDLGITIGSRHDPSIREVAVDAVKLHQILHNLVDNAIRYASKASRISIETERRPLEIVLSVVDDGCGIPEADLPHIFERFYRVDKGRSRELGGTGLGLSIVKHIALLHNGRVSAESRKGQGTRISVHFPAERPNVARFDEKSVRLAR